MTIYRDALKTQIIKAMHADFIAGKYFLFLGNTNPWENEPTPDSIEDSVSEEVYILNNMIGAIKLIPGDFYYGLERNNWVIGTVYDKFSSEINMKGENYYVTVVASGNTSYRVFICIDNNNGAQSTIEPSVSTSTTFNFFTTGDGYVWKMVFASDNDSTKIDSTPLSEIQTNDILPILDFSYDAGQNSDITFGSIEKINIVKEGETFPYAINVGINGNYTVLSNDTDDKFMLLYNVLDSTINKTSNYYEGKNYSLILRNATSGAIQYIFTIDTLDFVASGTNTYMQCGVCESFSSQSSFNGLIYQIVPKVKVAGLCLDLVAYPVLNSTTKKIEKIEIFDYGTGCSDVSLSIIGGYELEAVQSPIGGHGFNILHDLKINNIIIYKKIAPGADPNKISFETGVVNSTKSTFMIGVVNHIRILHTQNKIRQSGLVYRETLVNNKNDFLLNEVDSNVRNYDVLTLTKYGCPVLPCSFTITPGESGFITHGFSTFSTNDYLAQVSDSNVILAYGKVLSISFSEGTVGTDAAKSLAIARPHIAIQTLYGTFKADDNTDNPIDGIKQELQVYSPTTGGLGGSGVIIDKITPKNMITGRGRVVLCKNIEPYTLSSAVAVKFKFFITI